MERNLKLELKLGIFTFIGIIMLVYLVFSISDFKKWHSGYNIFIKFNFLNGVKVGSPVRFRGVDIGEVRDIQIVTEPETGKSYVKVNCWIKKSIRIPQDSQVWVNTLGLLGEKYLEIMPGNQTEYFIQPETIIKGNDPIAMHEMQELARKIAMDINSELSQLKNRDTTLGRLIYDDHLYKKLESIIDDLQSLVSDLKLHPWKLFFRPKKR